MVHQAGALISSRLAARVHQTLGRAAKATAEEAVAHGEDLIEAIQTELRSVYERGVENARRTHTCGAAPGGSGELLKEATAYA
jgi:hypothetical protein